MPVDIKKVGQKFYDRPIYETHMLSRDAGMTVAVATALGTNPPKPIHDLKGYERVKLQWMKPDGKGGLIQKF